MQKTDDSCQEGMGNKGVRELGEIDEGIKQKKKKTL